MAPGGQRGTRDNAPCGSDGPPAPPGTASGRRCAGTAAAWDACSDPGIPSTAAAAGAGQPSRSAAPRQT